VLYFDNQARLYRLDSQTVDPYRVDRSRPVSQSLIVTDGLNYFAVPEPALLATPQEQFRNLEEIQDYFFSDQAVEAALSVAPELLQRDDSGSLIHGTTGARALSEALNRVALGQGDTFLDIGCGCGLPVLVASRVSRCAHGVDVVPSVIQFARGAATDLGGNATFEEADIKDIPVESYDVIYIAATTFSEELRRIIRQKLSQLRPGAVVISLTYSFSCPHLVLVDSLESPFAWWKTSTPSPHKFYIHLRRAA
jgi:SAM-dependent methyltransferase